MLFLILPLLLVCPASGMNFSTWEDQQKRTELENAVGDLRMGALWPQGHRQPLMALTGINLDTFLFYFQLFLCTLWHPAVLFVTELGQTVFFPMSGIFISYNFLTTFRAAPLHVNYQACFFWLIFAAPYLSELSCPSSPLLIFLLLRTRNIFLCNLKFLKHTSLELVQNFHTCEGQKEMKELAQKCQMPLSFCGIWVLLAYLKNLCLNLNDFQRIYR